MGEELAGQSSGFVIQSVGHDDEGPYVEVAGLAFGATKRLRIGDGLKLEPSPHFTWEIARRDES